MKRLLKILSFLGLIGIIAHPAIAQDEDSCCATTEA